MTEMSTKAKALSKESISLLLDMISKHHVVTSKIKNASSNKQKDDAWKLIAQKFCAVTGEIRSPEQLRLKWENLKKSVRKRYTLMRQNNVKMESGKAFFQDEVFDRVASILGATSNDVPAEFEVDGDAEGASVQEPTTNELPYIPQFKIEIVDDGCVDSGLEAGSGNEAQVQPNKNFTHNTINGLKRRKLCEERQRAQIDKNVAIATYFKAKAEKVVLESRKLELENKNLELLNKKLELEIRQLQQNKVKVYSRIKNCK